MITRSLLIALVTFVAPRAAGQTTRYIYHPLTAIGNSGVGDWNNLRQGVGSRSYPEGAVGPFTLNFNGPIGPINSLSGINDSDDVAGTEVVNLGEYRYATAVIGGTSTRITNNRSQARAINNRQSVLVNETFTSTSYLWRPGSGAGQEILAPDGAKPLSVSQLNNADQAAGTYTFKLPGGATRTAGFRWSDELGAQPIALPANVDTFEPRSINDSGLVLASVQKSGQSASLVLSEPSGITIALPASQNNSYGDLNNAGQVVFGKSIWDEANGTRNLVSLIDFPSEPPLTYYFSGSNFINDEGWILGTGIIQYSGFNTLQIYVMLEPVTVPAPTGLLSFGVAAAFGLHRRRALPKLQH